MNVNPLAPVKQQVENGFNSIWGGVQHTVSNGFTYSSQQIGDGASHLMKEVVDLILTTPILDHNTIVFKLWSFIRIVSFSLIGMMFAVEAYKKIQSSAGIGFSVEFKTLFVRFIYGIMLAAFSLDIVDIMINFNNAMVRTMRDNFSVYIITHLSTHGAWNFAITLGLLAVQVVLAFRLAIQYFMRLGEIWLMTILGPLVYTLWINPAWSGYLGHWLRRLFTTVFTQVFWALILAIYSNMVTRVAGTGNWQNACMSIAFLLIMLETPTFLRQFMDTQQNPIQLLGGISKKVNSSLGGIKTVAGKATGWIKKK